MRWRALWIAAMKRLAGMVNRVKDSTSVPSAPVEASHSPAMPKIAWSAAPM